MIHQSIVESVAPTTEPLTLTEFKDRLRVTSCDFDVELTELLKAARVQLEYDTHRAFVTQTLIIYFDEFPVTEDLEIRVAPVQSITSVVYTDTAGASQTFASSNYTEDLTSTPARLKVVDGVFWPAVDDIPQAVVITLVAGYGAASTVPAEAKLAIMESSKMFWGNCDGDKMKYDALVGKLAWSSIWKPV
jgi:uncharacterized phiE125 gp8 family phage protein